MENEKETKTYRFEKDVIKHAESNPMIPSFAEWACDRYKKEFMELETLAGKMQMYFDMANDCKERVVAMRKEQEKGTDLSNLKPTERLWLTNEAPRRIRNATFEGVYKSFCNTFNREDINRRQFKLIVDRLDPSKPDINPQTPPKKG